MIVALYIIILHGQPGLRKHTFNFNFKGAGLVACPLRTLSKVSILGLHVKLETQCLLLWGVAYALLDFLVTSVKSR